ncbi:Glyoxalase-like domain [Aeromonas encheleia]|jgi:predicted enzyme related to lactoylglutathione lyase|uniref:Glyoxalase/bleomycin resistance/dioxygenase family protein n=1 Tax=Aeromonas encheleia TaxID=73010 RepID=A0AAE9SBD3_9GAMM|nr:MULTISPECIES: glyoxalase/bleomycin resistance/dioxygenase family protein [Aeromonas]MBV7415928.1 glyoxalase/bleomycin resistance/dioxygenase family protein [Aeromonas sp. sif2433]MBV7438232.1 glyoxalase/bleomycin resistance/dioxygenase family protein [Aeromonas sp. sif2416]MBV7597437.1 glyoxalase/bleomycin resistance/dioxygenase family protein [Aeromonas sp. sia0103]UNP89223.1 glyoxalase/bleomycin resistance/dioxygenase family protein [Aeromonas encheleia]USV56828.1 glyoxalase/bleomycin res
MPGPARAGALIYAKDLGRLTHFYRTLLQMEILSQDEGFVVLENRDIQLLLHAIPDAIASGIQIAVPPRLREEGAIKPFFTVSSLAWAEAKAADLGGGLLPQQWSAPGFVLRNAFDPEGNILQLRESLTAPDPL